MSQQKKTFLKIQQGTNSTFVIIGTTSRNIQSTILLCGSESMVIFKWIENQMTSNSKNFGMLVAMLSRDMKTNQVGKPSLQRKHLDKEAWFFCNFWGPMKQVNPLKTPFYIPCLLKRLAPCGRINQFDGIYCSIGVPPVHFNSFLLLMLKMLLTYLADMMQMVQMISTGHDCHRSGMMLVRALSRSNEMTTTQ